MQDQTIVATLKEIIDFLEAGISASDPPFYFLSLKLTRELFPEERQPLLALLKGYSKVGILPLEDPQIRGSEIHLIPNTSESPLRQGDGTLVTTHRVAQAIQRDFAVQGELLLNGSLRPFDRQTL